MVQSIYCVDIRYLDDQPGTAEGGSEDTEILLRFSFGCLDLVFGVYEDPRWPNREGQSKRQTTPSPSHKHLRTMLTNKNEKASDFQNTIKKRERE